MKVKRLRAGIFPVLFILTILLVLLIFKEEIYAEPDIHTIEIPQIVLEDNQEDNVEGNNTEEHDTLESDLTDFSEIEEIIKRILPDNKIAFEDVFKSFEKGENPLKSKELANEIADLLFQEFRFHKKNMVLIILLIVFSAFFSSFTSVFRNSQIAQLGFYSVYLLLLIVLMQDFSSVLEMIRGTIGNLLEFARALLPAYCIAMAGSGMVQSATIFYQFILVLIWAIQYVLIYGLIPLANGYVMLILVNYIAGEDMLKKMAELMKNLIAWTLKAMIGLVVGFNVIQGMVAPAMDSFKSAVLNKTMSAVPGVGNAAGAVTELIVGSGALIRNGIGAAGLVFVGYICLEPLVKILVFTVTYHIIGACMQPIADKRLIGGVDGIAKGGAILFRIMFTSALVLFLTIAIITAATGRIR